jgi:hypothetical protein
VLTPKERGLLLLALDPGAVAGEARNAWERLYRLLRERGVTGHNFLTGIAVERRRATLGDPPPAPARRSGDPLGWVEPAAQASRARQIYYRLYEAGAEGLTRTELRAAVRGGTMTTRADMDQALAMLLDRGVVRMAVQRNLNPAGGREVERWFAIGGKPPADWHEWLPDLWL